MKSEGPQRSKSSKPFRSTTRKRPVFPTVLAVAEEILKIKDDLIQLIQTSNCLELTEEEKQELLSFVSNLKELMAFQKTEDEIAQEFLLHMNVS